MKTVKRTLSILGCIFLAGLYIATLISALFDNTNTMVLFKACIYSTVIVPILIYAYILIYKLLKTHFHNKENDE